jgi:hypothetical protein
MAKKELVKEISLKRLRGFSIFWSLFIGIGAVWGSTMMFIDPSGKMWWGMDLILPYLQQLPFSDVFFQNFIPSGIVLLLVNGITNFVSFILIYKNHRLAGLSVLFCGIILIFWIIVQFFVFPLNPLSVIYFIFGLLQAWTGYKYWKKKNQINHNSDK